MYMCVYVYTYTYVYIYIYIHVCMYVCMYVCTYVCMYVCMYVYIYIYTSSKTVKRQQQQNGRRTTAEIDGTTILSNDHEADETRDWHTVVCIDAMHSSSILTAPDARLCGACSPAPRSGTCASALLRTARPPPRSSAGSTCGARTWTPWSETTLRYAT